LLLKLLRLRSVSFRFLLLFFTGGLGFDYWSVSTVFTISSTGSVRAPVVIIDDTKPEEPEMFFGNLAAGSGGGLIDFTNIMFAPDVATATISDNDGNKEC
jgi:hypothetical protein